VQVLGVLAALGDLRPLRRVIEIRQAGVIELEIPATELPDPADLIRVRGGQVVPELRYV
jgi:hypothetical protein